MSHTVTCTTRDGVTLTFPCADDATVLDAAASAGSILPQLCGQGACGACVATRETGDVRLGSFNADAIGPMDGDNAVLLCRCHPTSDVSFTLPYGSDRVVSGAPVERQTTVTAVDVLSDDVRRLLLTLTPDDEHGTAAEFDPGQCFHLHVPGTDARRAYSVANIGNWDGHLEFLIKLVPGGAMSTWLAEHAAVGDALTITGPQGAFSLHENGLRPRWFIAGGTGLAPVLSMMRRMAEWGDPQPVRLFVGCTTEHDLYGTPMIADVIAGLPDATVTTCVWHPSATDHLTDGDPGIGHVHVGTPADASAAALHALGLARDDGDAPCVETPDIYVCGPPAMVHAVEYALAEEGAEPDHVYTEKFALLA